MPKRCELGREFPKKISVKGIRNAMQRHNGLQEYTSVLENPTNLNNMYQERIAFRTSNKSNSRTSATAKDTSLVGVTSQIKSNSSATVGARPKPLHTLLCNEMIVGKAKATYKGKIYFFKENFRFYIPNSSLDQMFAVHIYYNHVHLLEYHCANEPMVIFVLLKSKLQFNTGPTLNEINQVAFVVKWDCQSMIQEVIHLFPMTKVKLVTPQVAEQRYTQLPVEQTITQTACNKLMNEKAIRSIFSSDKPNVDKGESSKSSEDLYPNKVFENPYSQGFKLSNYGRSPAYLNPQVGKDSKGCKPSDNQYSNKIFEDPYPKGCNLSNYGRPLAYRNPQPQQRKRENSAKRSSILAGKSQLIADYLKSSEYPKQSPIKGKVCPRSDESWETISESPFQTSKTSKHPVESLRSISESPKEETVVPKEETIEPEVTNGAEDNIPLTPQQDSRKQRYSFGRRKVKKNLFDVFEDQKKMVEDSESPIKMEEERNSSPQEHDSKKYALQKKSTDEDERYNIFNDLCGYSPEIKKVRTKMTAKSTAILENSDDEMEDTSCDNKPQVRCVNVHNIPKKVFKDTPNIRNADNLTKDFPHKNQHFSFLKETSYRKVSTNSPRKRVSSNDSLQEDNKYYVIYPPPPVKQGLVILEKDVNCLQSHEWLNDTIIDFWIRYTYDEIRDGEEQKRLHIFGSLFSSILGEVTDESPKSSSLLKESKDARLGRWTKNVNIFEKDFLIIPTNHGRNHWFLIVVCFLGKTGNKDDEILKKSNEDVDILDMCSEDILQERPCILVFDSMPSERETEINNLQNFFELQYQQRKGRKISFESLPAIYLNVPKQDNGYDCGIFVLQYFETFCDTLLKSFQVHLSSFENWFHQNLIKGKRQKIKETLNKMHKHQTANGQLEPNPDTILGPYSDLF